MDVYTMAKTIARFPESGDFLTFVEEFLLKNEPCMFPAAITSGWRARREWQMNGRPNLDYLDSKFGDAAVPVADCSKQQFDSHWKTEMKMSDYLSYWRTHIQESKERQLTPGADREGKEPRLLYLKDWHFFKQYPEYGGYIVPPYFTADWLNEVWDQRNDVSDDYRFVYFGPTGTWTPFHADVFRSYSWSANVCGKKEWLLLPPGEEVKLRDKCGRLPFDLRQADLRPLHVNLVRVVQEEGEIIFVPSGWHHQVQNMEDTISINHNWVNGFGVWPLWRHIHCELQLVKSEIADCRAMAGWENHCQVMLRACVGLDYLELFQMLCLLALPRLAELDSLLPSSGSPPLFSPLREAIARATGCGELSWFGQRRGRETGERGKDVTVIDGLRDILRDCDWSSGSARCQSVRDCLSEEEEQSLASVCDVMTNTLCTLRSFELSKISQVLIDLMTDSDMNSIVPHNILQS